MANTHTSRKTIIVTGGIRGIGAAISLRLSKAGYNVIASYRSNNDLAKEFEDAHNIKTMQWDAANYDKCKEAASKIIENYGAIAGLVNNAGITDDAMLHKMTKESWDKVINANLSSCFNMCSAVIGNMRNNGFGRIVSISSVNGLAGQIGQTNYSASKAGIIGFTKALALESASKGITVNAIAPGYIDTDMMSSVPDKVLEHIISQVPVGRLGKADEIARAVLFLIEDEAGFITGETISINGGHYMH